MCFECVCVSGFKAQGVLFSEKTINEELHWLPPWLYLAGVDGNGGEGMDATESWGRVSACVWGGHKCKVPY